MATLARPGPSPVASPRTPQRGISSTFSSPGSFRAEDDAVIFEIGSRYLRAGWAGDSVPKCCLGAGPEESRRVGDYRRWLPGYEERSRPAREIEAWGRDHELWRLDVRNVDLGLVEDKIERTVRDAYSRFLLLDSKSKKGLLVVPSVISNQILSLILSVLFDKFQLPSIALLPPPTMSVVAAGQRSGLVVDIGWHETVVTSVYELREINHHRSTRAMRLLVEIAGRLFQDASSQSPPAPELNEQKMTIDFDYVEELVTRVIWCQMAGSSNLGNSISNLRLTSPDRQQQDDTKISVPLPRRSDRSTQIPFSSLSEPVESAFFANGRPLRDQDDHEHPLHYLIYRALVALQGDVRAVCLSRIMFTGGGSNIPGLKTRLLNELKSVVGLRGWDPVVGKAADEQQRRKAEKAERMKAATQTASKVADDTEDDSSRGAAFEEQVPDELMEKIREKEAKGTKPSVSSVIVGLETMGPWAGASLTAAVKVKSVVEIDRDVFLQHGLSGAKRHSDINPNRPKSNTGTLTRIGAAENTGWTLGAWA